MVVKMMRWRPRPPLSRKYEVKLVLKRLQGLSFDNNNNGYEEEEDDDDEKEKEIEEEEEERNRSEKLTVEIKWKGPKSAAIMSSLRRVPVKRNFTRLEGVDRKGNVDWDEEFQSVCSLTNYKDNVFHPWEIGFTVFKGLLQGLKNKDAVIGTASLNLGEYASKSEEKEFELNIPLTLPSGASDSPPILCLSLGLVELRTSQETTEPVEMPVVPATSPLSRGEAVAAEKDELSAIKMGLQKVKILTEYVSVRRRSKKTFREEDGSEGRCSGKSDDGEGNYPLDTESFDDSEEGESDEAKGNSSFRKSFSYGTLAYANCAGDSYYSTTRISSENENWVYYSNRRLDAGCSSNEEPIEQAQLSTSKRGLLSWRKRKLSFRSPKTKGEPLLKKAYAEEGGDDIDFDRRQLSSDEALGLGWYKMDEDSSANRSSVSEFGDDNFAVGSWEQKEVVSRDGNLKLETQVFFASIDQRSERAAGESACTALVAVIADWFQMNRGLMPIKSQFDSLIRDGSLEWRKLCDNEAYRERFPDRHFDLETVLQAKIRPLAVVPEKSFIGFFHPDGMDEGRLDFLHGALSFDNIWDEISRAGSECSSIGESLVYIVSWNDHFFILKVDPDAYYIIDTLGERLYEGCNQAYILRFDASTTIRKLPNDVQSSDDKTTGEQQNVKAAAETKNQAVEQVNPKEESSAVAVVEGSKSGDQGKSDEEEEVVCQGKESCKEYIKSFLAAIPLRELQVDLKKGLMASTPLHHRLQIEFHYARYAEPLLAITWPPTDAPAGSAEPSEDKMEETET